MRQYQQTDETSKLRYLFAILTCDENRFRANAARRTWIRDVPENVQVIFVQARPGVKPGIEGDTLWLSCSEGYENLPTKISKLFGFLASNNELRFDYVLKTDDDTFIRLDKFLNFPFAGADYIGQFKDSPLSDRGKQWHFGKCKDKAYEVPDDRPFVCGWAVGGGYVLSRKALRIVAKSSALVCKEYIFEDRMVGELLTLNPEVTAKRALIKDMGIINSLLPKDMEAVHELVIELRDAREKCGRELA